MLKIFIGYDAREPEAYDVCAESLRRTSSMPLAIIPLKQPTLREKGFYTRPVDEPAATEFAFTRFLVPYLSDYQGFSLFCDCDFLFTQDIRKLGEEIKKICCSVYVVKHDYTPKAAFKMDGQPQVAYPRKNWSSLMLFDNTQFSKTLTPEYVNSASAADLHQFKWIPDEEIGDISREWNWLEGEYDWPRDIRPPAGIHFTNGGPWNVAATKAVRFGKLWTDLRDEIQKKKAITQ